MDKVRLFLQAAVGEDEVEKYIKNDHWIEFPSRSLGRILAEYEAAQPSVQADGAGYCPKCGAVRNGIHTAICPNRYSPRR